jgi:hypothetical protein
MRFLVALITPIMLSELVVKDRNVHAFVVLPHFAGCALNPGSFGCEVVVAADAAADFVIVVVVFVVEL